MEWLVLVGTVVSLLGLVGIIGCVIAVLRARRAGLTDAELRARLAPIVAMNIGALFVSVLGLMLVVIGLFLG
ncbi:hypothetical protein [Phaeovulum sp.]|uniref:hypothetical protein n=1 Tax=Phaeovulum sp. TaxID=2934796 RepID=UPI0035634101